MNEGKVVVACRRGKKHVRNMDSTSILYDYMNGIVCLI